MYERPRLFSIRTIVNSLENILSYIKASLRGAELEQDVLMQTRPRMDKKRLLGGFSLHTFFWPLKRKYEVA